MTLTLPPISLAVSAKLLLQIDAVVDQQNLEIARGRGDARSMRATKTMVSDLPEPCVCQTTPERSSAVLPVRSRSMILRAARYCW